MHWVQSLDAELFRFFHLSIKNPVLDAVMPSLGESALFVPLMIVLGVALIFRGGPRAWLCVLMLILLVSVCDGWVCNSIKRAVERPRPFLVIAEAAPLIGKGKSFSMPSSHAANWFCATMIL